MFGLLLRVLSIVGTMASVMNCDTKSVFTITSMSFSPDPTIPGQNSTLQLSLEVPTEITGGTATYDTMYNFIPFAPVVDPLCGTVVCPIKVGPLSTWSSYPMDFALSGRLTIKITWRDSTDRVLMCVSVRTTLGDSTRQVGLRRNSSHH